MIWEYSVIKIVMLCGLEEDGRLACDVYFPDLTYSQKVMNIGNEFELVHIKIDKTNPFYWVRTIQIKNLKNGQTREVYHYHVRIIDVGVA